jgi:GTP cyclohydrolase II
VRIPAQLREAGSGLALSPPAAAQSSVPSAAEEAARLLVRLSGLAPAALVSAVQPHDQFSGVAVAQAEEITRYLELKPKLERTTPAPVHLPLAVCDEAKVIGYRDTLTHTTHLAVLLGNALAKDAPLTRVHSSCVTGDLLGSLRCECGDQLHAALAAIAAEGGGILLYLVQEGRGIGLVNKLRAYGLQDHGMDTVEANTMLGFEPDARDFSAAGQILASLGVAKVRLLTNNPAKVNALEEQGIHVVERVPLVIEASEHNRRYLDTKAKRMDHLF